MDTSLLRIFIDAVRRGSFAAVARDRDTDPSSISRAITTLEEELGVRLFQRTTRQLALTEAGSAYFERVASLVEELEQAQLAAADTSDSPRGQLRVTASVSFGQKCLVPLLADFMSAYPELTIDLLLSDAVIDMVTERIDLAIRLGLLTDSTFISSRLLHTIYSVCASPEYLARRGPLRAPHDLKGHDCLLFPFSGFRSRWIFRNDRDELLEVPVTGRVVISNAAALHQCAVAGMGVALLPQWIVGADLRDGVLVNVFPEHAVTATDFNTGAWLLHPSRAYVPLKVRVFMDFLKQEFRERPPWLR